jgi:hypothetical protein
MAKSRVKKTSKIIARDCDFNKFATTMLKLFLCHKIILINICLLAL